MYEYINSIDGCEYRIVHVKPTRHVKLTDYVLNHRTAGYFICIKKDKNGGKTHAIGIDISKRVIYDSMESSILSLNNASLNRCCGQDRKFDSFVIVAELQLYKKKPYKNQKKRKDAIMDGDSLKSGCHVAKPRLDVASTELDEDDVLFASLDGYDSSDNPRVDVNLKPPTPDDIMDGKSLNSGRCVVDAIVIDDSDSESSDHCTKLSAKKSFGG